MARFPLTLADLIACRKGNANWLGAAPFSVWSAERLEGQAILGAEFDLDTYGQLTDRLGRAFQRLGLKRVPRDVTPTLSAIVQKHKAAAPAADKPNGHAAATVAPAPEKPVSVAPVEEATA